MTKDALSRCIRDVVSDVRAGVSPVCDPVPPGPNDFGVLTLKAITANAIDRRNAKRLGTATIRNGWPTVRAGTVLITRASGSRDLVGVPLLVEKDEPRLILPDTVWALEVTGNHSSRFLVEYLRSPKGRKAVHEITRGSNGIWKISQRSFLSLALPSASAQLEATVDRLAAAFSPVMGTWSRFLVAKRHFRRGLLQELLSGRLRFTEFRHSPWRTSALGDHVKRVTRRNGANLHLVLTASGDRGLVDQRQYFKRRVASIDLEKYYLLRQGEFAYNRSAMIGYPFGATKRLDDYEAGALSTLYLCFAINDPDLDSDYLTCVFESGVLDRQLRRIARVGARAHGLLNVTDDDFFAVSIPLPCLDEQRRIAGLVKLVDLEIRLLERQRKGVESHMTALFGRLLAGESVPS